MRKEAEYLSSAPLRRFKRDAASSKAMRPKAERASTDAAKDGHDQPGTPKILKGLSKA